MGVTNARIAFRRWTWTIALASTLVLVPFVTSRAIDPTTELAHAQHDLWQTQDGLPQNDVYAILQTRDGYLWFGTEEGLVRFDGVTFTVFDKRNTPALRVNNISSLFEDAAGQLWIGTKGGGLCRYADGAFTTYTTSEGLSNNQVWSILGDRSGRLWVGTAAGLNQLENGAFTPITVKDGLTSDNIRALCEDRDGRIWIGTSGGGVNRLEANGRIVPLTKREGLTSDFVQSIRETRDGTVWIGTAGGGLVHVSGGTLDAITTREGLSSDFIWSIYEDSNGTMWVGTNDGGLDRIRDGAITAYTERDGLSNDSVLSVCEDREGSLWVGTGSGGGLNRFKDGKVVVLTTRDGLSSTNVHSVCEGRDGSLWIATEDGLTRLLGGKATVLDVSNGLLGSNVTSLHEASDGSLWIGVYGKGVNRLKDGRIAAYTPGNGPENGIVRLITEDRAGGIWLGTNRGAAIFRDGAWSSITSDDGLSADVVTSVYEARDGVMWIGTYGGGLNRVDHGAITVLTTEQGLTSNNIRFTFEDDDGALWIGTEGGGLDRLKEGRIAAVTIANGLHDDTAFDDLRDASGNLWMNCNKGVFRVSTKALTDVADGRADVVDCVAYGLADGMLSAECNSGMKPGSWLLRDGRLAFATNKGLVLLDPAKLRPNTVLPPVYVERVLVDGRELGPSDSTSFAPGAESFEFHYTALSLRTPERVRFRYFLEGFDHAWADAGTRRTAYYTNVPHGTYRFRVLACNDDGLWNGDAATFEFTIEPYFYQTWWFALCAGAVIVLAAFGLHRARIYRLRARERELVALVSERTQRLRDERDRTEAERAEAERQSARAEEANRAKSVFLATMSHELRTPLNAVLGFAQLMERDPSLSEDHRESVATIMQSGEHLLGLINDVLSLSKIEAGKQVLAEHVFDLHEVITLLAQMTRVRAEAKRLELRVEVADDLPQFVRGDEGKLKQILLNLLGNAVKFTDSGSVTLSASRATPKSDRLVFEVADTGRGIAPDELAVVFTPFVQTQSGLDSQEGTGLGLALSENFARQMGGGIEVTSEVGRGTTFRLALLLPSAEEQEARARGGRRQVLSLAPGEPSYSVLVVDDVMATRKLLVRLLTAAGFTCREAADGEEAVGVWSTWRPAVILMDVRMRGVDGLEATRRIRSAEAATGERVPIIAVSASVLDHEVEDVLSSGCDDFLPKPFREASLFEKIGALVGARFEGPGVSDGAVHAPPRGELASLGAVAPPLVRRLKAAVVDGDLEECRRVAAEIRAVDDALGRTLEAMIGRYELEAIDRLISAGAAD